MYAVRTHMYPALGKVGEARTIYEAFVKQRQSQGHRDSLQSQLFGDGPALIRVAIYDSIADFEQDRKALNASPEFQEVSTKLQLLSRSSPDIELFEFIVPPVP